MQLLLLWSKNIGSEVVIIPLLAFFAVMSVGISVLLSLRQKKRIVEMKIQESIAMGQADSASGRKSGLLQLLEKIGNVVSHGHASTNLWEQLVRAGYLGKNAPAIYTGVKMLLFIAGFVVGGILLLPTELEFTHKITLICLAGTVLFFVPNFVVLMQEKKRCQEVCQHLPEALDLLEICVSSGVGLDMAWNMVGDEIEGVSPVLATAMALTNFEIHLGASRAQAMRHMATRTGANALSSLAAILIQTDRFGTSVAAALREFAASMREERHFSAEESAEKMAVKLLIPMVLFIFPAVMIIVAGPAGINIFKAIFVGG